MPDTDRDPRPVSERVREPTRSSARPGTGSAPGSGPDTEVSVRSPMSDPPRTQIGPYQLIAKIGEGGMGTVWLTKLPGPAGFNKLAVVKELRADLTSSPAFVEMFLNEARLAARLTHPNVVHTYGANEDKGRLYIAMEYLDGQPWSAVRHALWSNRSLPLALHLKVLADTLSGLHYAHELRDYDGTALQVVHRDVSPQNVFVTYDGQVKVVDFGVARAITQGAAQESAPMFVGKVAYSGPEQLRGDPVDRRADVFAVGVMLWEACAGRRLNEGQDRSEAVRKRASEPAPRIREVVSSMPRALADICDRAIALNPADRYSTAAEFRDALVAYLDESSQDVDNTQLGQLVAAAFRDERSRINGLIERSLMQRATSLPAPQPPQHLIDTLRPPPGGPPAEHTLRADLSELASVSKLQNEEEMLEASNSVAMRVVDAQRRERMVIGAGIAVVIIGGFLWWRAAQPKPDTVTAHPLPPLPTQTSPDETPAAAPSAPAAKAAAADAKPEQAAAALMQLQISATPAHATLFLDGTPVSNPYSAKVEADGELHLIRASAPGMQTQERVIELDENAADKSLQITLAPLKHGAGAGPRREGAARAAPASPSTEAATKKPASAAAADDDFDSRITPESKARPIYEEDPY